MPKMNGNDNFFIFTSRLVLCCSVIVTIGPMYHTTVADPIVTKVSTGEYKSADHVMWSEKLNSVCFVDTSNLQLIKYQPDGNPAFVAVSLDVHSYLGFLVPVKTNETKFAIGNDNEISVFQWDGISTTGMKPQNYLRIPLDETRGVEMVTCGKADVCGRLWVGTRWDTEDYSTRGMLYTVDESGKFAVKLSNIGVPSAIAWSPDNTQIYYAEPTRIISTEFNKDTGELIGNGTCVFDFAAHGFAEIAKPCSMTVDKDGFLWVPFFQMSFVMKIDPVNKSVLTQVEFPDADSTTSIMFVGPNVGDIYVTSSNALFHVTNTGSKGIGGVNEVVINWPYKEPEKPPFLPSHP